MTNPPLDAIREELVTSMGSTIGPERNLLKPEPESCRQIRIKYPIIHNEHVAKLRHLPPDSPFRSTTLSMLFDPAKDGPALEQAMDDLCRRASEAVAAGYNILILSDRGVGPRQAPIPSLLATAGVHHHLVREGTRTRCALVVESGDAREVHHVSLLLGYGAGVVNPYVAFETLDDMIRQGMLTGIDARRRRSQHYIKALNKGILKVMSKMGISTLQSYCGAQIFEAIGLSQAFIDQYFTHTTSRIGGVGIDVDRRGSARCGTTARSAGSRRGAQELEAGGEYQWRRDGEYHLFNPETVFKLQHATRSGQYTIFKEYTRAVDEQNEHRATLRGLFRLKPVGPPVPLDEVEPVERDRQAVRDRRDVVRLDQPGGARDAGDRDEPPRRQVEHRRGRRGSGALRAAGQRRLEAQRDQAGRVGPLRRDQRVPGQRRRAADQDGAGRQAGRGRPAARAQGLSVDRQDAALDARRRPDLAAAAPRHLFDRGSGAADLRPEELEPAGADLA